MRSPQARAPLAAGFLCVVSLIAWAGVIFGEPPSGRSEYVMLGEDLAIQVTDHPPLPPALLVDDDDMVVVLGVTEYCILPPALLVDDMVVVLGVTDCCILTLNEVAGEARLRGAAVGEDAGLDRLALDKKSLEGL